MNAQHKRRRFYVDHVIQRRLVIALILLEGLLICASVLYLHGEFKAIIERDLYRIHNVDELASAKLFMVTMGKVLAAFLAINVVALLIGEWIWGRYVHAVLAAFSRLAEKTARLDFTPDPRLGVRHEVLDLALIWRRHERERLSRLNDAVDHLDADANTESLERLAALKLSLARLSMILPQRQVEEKASP